VREVVGSPAGLAKLVLRADVEEGNNVSAVEFFAVLKVAEDGEYAEEVVDFPAGLAEFVLDNIFVLRADVDEANMSAVEFFAVLRVAEGAEYAEEVVDLLAGLIDFVLELTDFVLDSILVVRADVDEADNVSTV
jgi:hypothetical protein